MYQAYRKRSRNLNASSLSKRMLTVGEVCQLLNIHSNTLRRWGAKGLIKEYRIGPSGQRRYRADDVLALLLEQSEKD
jgi:excisionase family DNA binding protein